MTVFVLVNLAIFGLQFYLNYAVDNERYGALAHLGNLRSLALVFGGFFVYAVVAPLGQLTHDLTLGDAARYLDRWTAAAAVTAYGALLAVVAARWRTPRDRMDVAIGAWLLTLTLFYVYFNPIGMMLYAPQVLPAWLLLVARGYVTHSATRWQSALLILAAALLLLHNVPAIYRPIELS